MKNKNISYGKNVYDKEEIEAVVNTLKNNGTAMDRSVTKFENNINKKYNKKYGLMVNSGSSALMLAFDVLQLKKNDEVICPCLNFPTAFSAMILYGIKPRLVDVKIETLCINEDLILKNINNKTRAICVPNLIGYIPNWKIIRNIVKKKNIIIIEDSADCLGSKIHKKSTGYYSDISITSFYGSHVISCAGNGGYIGFNDKKLYEKAKLKRSWGRNSSLFSKKESEKIINRFQYKINKIDYDSKFIFSEKGYNFEPSELGAAFGLIQLKKLKKNNLKRRTNFKYLKENLEKISKYFYIPENNSNVISGKLALPLIIKKNKYFNRKNLMIYLEKNKIQCRVIFSGNILLQPGFKLNEFANKKNHFPITDAVMKNGLLLGIHHGINKNDLNYILKVIKIFLSKCKNKY